MPTINDVSHKEAFKVHERWGILILNGLKKWELRKQPVREGLPKRVSVMYTGKAVDKVQGKVNVLECVEKTKEEILSPAGWAASRVSERDFVDYFGDANRVYAWILSDPEWVQEGEIWQRKIGPVVWVQNPAYILQNARKRRRKDEERTAPDHEAQQRVAEAEEDRTQLFWRWMMTRLEKG
jgi:predicted transcriptional regulator